MPHFVIAGKADCPLFVHALQIAQFLKENLPEIDVEKKEFMGDAWNEFLLDINSSNRWFITKSPVIWKEVSPSGGKPHLIGGLSEFWEYIDDYYQIQTFLDRKTIEELCSENFQAHLDRMAWKRQDETHPCVLGIFGFNNNYAQILFTQILDIRGIFNERAITVKIYDPESLRNKEVEKQISELIKELIVDFVKSPQYRIEPSKNMSDFVMNTDIILITEDFSQLDSEDRETWLKKVAIVIDELSIEINDFGKPSLKIVCCHLGPVCFTATGLLQQCKRERKHSIVAITAQEGLSAVNIVSKLSEIPASMLGAPPVWGFVGLDKFIDVRGMTVLREIVRPYKRALKNVEGSTLPQKKIFKELRFLSCNINQSDFENEMIKRCNKYVKVGKTPALPLVRATIHLLECWFTHKDTDEVISLGIASTCAFGIPPHIVFSQPAFLNSKGYWKPFENIPIVEQSRQDLRECVEYTYKLINTIMSYF